ncbi:MAG: short-chain dehydrogenase [Betaproteobacteria bacterium RIFCSPLOWO2_12_FULL_62_58]|nr:MAG: short-chain dehydrogenase [Betaproteobacteria bacterium RIFCSPLOWO2_12_FULL_62_58]
MTEQQAVTVPSPVEFFLNVPLYEIFPYDGDSAPLVWNVEYFEGTLDSYCHECGAHSIFDRTPKDKHYDLKKSTYDHVFAVELTCTRNRKHTLFFLFKAWKKTVQKVGQYPSIADLNLFDVKTYSAVLPKEQFREFTRAIGLSAHGIGVGSFVYLRRIFESLIAEAYALERAAENWDEAQYQQSRMSEKIEILKARLPDFLVHNRGLYGILSKGIHELTENECLKAFPIVKVGIEIILDAKLEQLQRTRKQREAEKAIQALASSVSNNGSQT